MVRRILGGVVLAVSAMVGVMAWAQEKGQTIILDGKPFIVDTWLKGPDVSSVGIAVISPPDAQPKVDFVIRGVGNWDLVWRNLPDSQAGASCAEEERLVRALAREAGLAVTDFEPSRCKDYSKIYNTWSSFGSARFSRAAQPPEAQKCTADAWLGTWQRPGTAPQAKVLQLQFTKGQYGGLAKAQGYNGHPEFNGKQVIDNIYSETPGCTYLAQCSMGISAPVSCKLTIDPAKNTLLVQDRNGIRTYFDGPWTRSATPLPTAATCSARDIDGNWHRSDGALVPIVGIDAGFRDGGNALMFNHPDIWPKGSHKFLRVFRDGGPDSCKLSAVCISYETNRSTGQAFKRERACTLTIDPERQTLSESGSTLSYSRTPKSSGGGQQAPRSITTAPAEPPVSVPVTSAQELAEIATRERLNREQAAFAQKQLAENAAAKAAFEKATADREATIAAQAAEAARKQREYEAAMAKWRADVEACKNGDRSRCAQ